MDKKSISKFASNLTESFHLIFLGSLMLYLVLLILENVIKGSVSNTLNLNILLAIVFSTGLIGAFTPKQDLPKETEHKFLSWDSLLILFLSVGSVFLVYYKMQDLGNIAWSISIGAGILIAMIGYILLKLPEEE
ncbi:hypothetical protein KKI23_00035 [Patescibacteria group bacterium]|nr:hypothetical protein [Patescibacteria group bacterium]